MFPPLFQTLFADSPTKAIFGSSPLRAYAFGDAPAKGATGYLVPYAIFQTLTGSPENYLGQVPDVDGWLAQVDVYAASLTDARDGARAIRNALQTEAYIDFGPENRDTETQLYRYTMTVSFITVR